MGDTGISPATYPSPLAQSAERHLAEESHDRQGCGRRARKPARAPQTGSRAVGHRLGWAGGILPRSRKEDSERTRMLAEEPEKGAVVEEARAGSEFPATNSETVGINGSIKTSYLRSLSSVGIDARFVSFSLSQLALLLCVL